MEYLVLMEVGKKQSYIFKSNKIKENIGASQIIQYVTEDLPNEKVKALKGSIVMNGGGKSLYKFLREEDGIAFIKEVSKEVLKNYPGLDLYFVRDEIDENRDNFSKKIEELYIKLGNKKSMKSNSMNQVSLGIEKVCSSTGLPGVAYDGDKVISEEIKSKIEFTKKSNNKSIIKGNNVRFSKVLDDFKGDDKSYIGVIHIDGNSMGNKFSELSSYWRKKIEENKTNNKKYIEEINSLSNEIKCAYENAFEEVINASVEKGESSIRPIILAGDDVTFVCKAEDSIKLSRIFIESLNKNKVKIGEKEVILNAAVGIAFVKSHFPFSRAYDLAEELCANCKSEIKKLNKDTSMIDWHILQGENSSSIQEIRRGQYKADGLTLNIRPLYFDGNNEYRNLDIFKETLRIINKDVSRNKVKTLRGEYTRGSEAVKIFMEYYGLTEEFSWINEIKATNGIYDNRAIFFDAIEIMDLVKEV